MHESQSNGTLIGWLPPGAKVTLKTGAGWGD
jgi:hypothetical protein